MLQAGPTCTPSKGQAANSWMQLEEMGKSKHPNIEQADDVLSYHLYRGGVMFGCWQGCTGRVQRLLQLAHLPNARPYLHTWV